MILLRLWRNRVPAILLALAWARVLTAETKPTWDNPREAGWGENFARVSIPSSADGKVQLAMWHATTNSSPQPLIVSLHTWSGDFRQSDPLAAMAVARGFNYIHPDFRGPNHRPEACGSDLVVSDIDDAMEFAFSHGRVDRANVHVIGVSGGGHATMLAWMRSRLQVRSFSAWVGISDLVQWYHQSVGRNARYATNLCQVTTGDPARFDPVEARKRSPLSMQTPLDRRAHSKLYLYAGVHDGHTGSVPITQTIDFFNHVVRNLNPAETASLVPANVIQSLVQRRALPASGPAPKRQHGDTIYQRRFQDRVQLVIFEGGHEMLAGQALDHVPSATILAVGDSNGASPDGWVARLSSARFQDVVINASVAGNTFGFDNLDNPKLNTLRNIDAILAQAVEAAGSIDHIVILLGTNDSKAAYANRADEVLQHAETLLQTLRVSPYLAAHPPRVLLVSPPPMGPENRLAAKYQGGSARVAQLAARLGEVARRNEAQYLDIHTPLQGSMSSISEDGVHLLAPAQQRVAEMIEARLKASEKRP